MATAFFIAAESTGGGPPALHAPTHIPGGTDPLDTGIAGTIAVGDAAAVGVGVAFSRNDHRHALPVPALPAAQITGAGTAGVATTVARADHVHPMGSFGVEYRGLRGMDATNHFDISGTAIGGNGTGFEVLVAFIKDQLIGDNASNQYLLSTGLVFTSGYHMGWIDNDLRVYWHNGVGGLVGGGQGGFDSKKAGKVLFVLGLSYDGANRLLRNMGAVVSTGAMVGFTTGTDARIGSQPNGTNPLINDASLIALGYKSDGVLTASEWEEQMRTLLLTGDFADGNLTSRWSIRDLPVGAAPATLVDEIGANDWTLTGALTVVTDAFAGIGALG